MAEWPTGRRVIQAFRTPNCGEPATDSFVTAEEARQPAALIVADINAGAAG